MSTRLTVSPAAAMVTVICGCTGVSEVGISEIYDFSRSFTCIDKGHGAPAGQVSVHLPGIDNKQIPLLPVLRAVGMAIHQQVERTRRFQRLQQVPVISVHKPNPHPAQIHPGKRSRDFHGGMLAGFSFEQHPVPVIVPEYSGEGCFLVLLGYRS